MELWGNHSPTFWKFRIGTVSIHCLIKGSPVVAVTACITFYFFHSPGSHIAFDCYEPFFIILTFFENSFQLWGYMCNSVVECLVCMCQVQSSMPHQKKKGKSEAEQTKSLQKNRCQFICRMAFHLHWSHFFMLVFRLCIHGRQITEVIFWCFKEIIEGATVCPSIPLIIVFDSVYFINPLQR